jgi:hypothetical protein
MSDLTDHEYFLLVQTSFAGSTNNRNQLAHSQARYHGLRVEMIGRLLLSPAIKIDCRYCLAKQRKLMMLGLENLNVNWGIKN